MKKITFLTIIILCFLLLITGCKKDKELSSNNVSVDFPSNIDTPVVEENISSPSSSVTSSTDVSSNNTTSQTSSSSENTSSNNSSTSSIPSQNSNNSSTSSSSSNTSSNVSSNTSSTASNTSSNTNSNTSSNTSSNVSSNTSSTTSSTSKPEVIRPTNEMISVIKSEFLRLVNNERKNKGVGELSCIPLLNNAADKRANECFDAFSHTRPNGNPYYTIFENEFPYEYTSVAENITLTTNFGDKIIQESDIFIGTNEQLLEISNILYNNFKNSPSHYANMVSSSYTEIGIGIATIVDDKQNVLYITCANIFIS